MIFLPALNTSQTNKQTVAETADCVAHFQSMAKGINPSKSGPSHLPGP